ncbi:MAG: hypothetical protein D3924_19065 [Candidatus Electrothrix sp. AR4]|nr:hypothetical protein [Candidatus Electrothrix sp. AR4]
MGGGGEAVAIILGIGGGDKRGRSRIKYNFTLTPFNLSDPIYRAAGPACPDFDHTLSAYAGGYRR